EPDQLSIVYGRQGITVENRSGPRRSRSKNMVEAQTHKEVRAKISRSRCWSCSGRCYRRDARIRRAQLTVVFWE
ncbi:hypothetical protein L195_g061319, partial [Trifolium pratense]